MATKTRVSPVSWEKHGRGPAYCPCGVRCTDGVTLIRAFVRNLRTWPVAKGKRYKWKPHEAESTEAPARGALLRSSEETA